MATGTVVDVVMPQMGVSVSEGTITRWMKQVGDHIEADETIVEISTDKVDTEVPSPASGVVREILANEGDTVPVNTRIAVIASGDGLGDTGRSVAAGRRANQRETPGRPPRRRQTTASAGARRRPQPQAERRQRRRRRRLRPRVHQPGGGADAGRAPPGRDQIPGTGRGGRVTKKDVQAFIDGGGQAAAGHPRRAPFRAAAEVHDVPHFAPPPAPAAPPQPLRAAAPRRRHRRRARAGRRAGGSGGDEELYQFNTIRKVIARHMRHSLDTAAHVTTVIEVDMTGVVNLRKKWKPQYQQRYGVNLTYIPFIARATIDSIGRWPWVNAEVQGESAHDQEVRQPGHGGRHRRRQGPDGAGHPPRRGDEPGRAVARGDRDGREGAHQDADARRDGRRHVHDHQPGRLRRPDGHADHPRGAGRDPGRRGDREAAGRGHRPSTATTRSRSAT